MFLGSDTQQQRPTAQSSPAKLGAILRPRWLLGLLALLALLAACEQDATAGRPLVEQFEVSPLSVTAGQRTTFSWSVSASTAATCTLDVDGDGAADYTPECASGTQQHTYDEAGVFTATLEVTDGGKRSARSVQTEITPVQEENTPDTFSRLAWAQISDSPIDRHEAFGGFAADGKLYIFGGYSNIRENRFRPTREVHAYNPRTDTWEKRTNMPEGVSHAGIAIDGAAIYYAGGYPETTTSFGQTFSTRNVWKYDTTTDTYTQLPELPDNYGGGALALVNNVLHFYGGSKSDRSDSNDHWALSLDGTDSWSPAAGLPVPRNHLGSAVINGKIYAVGGQSGQDAAATYRDDVHRYDPQTDTWTQVASLPVALSHNNGSTFDMNGRIIVLGGEPSYGKSISETFAYDPKNDSWQELTMMPIAKNAGVGGHVDGRLYHVTGSTSADAFRGTPLE